jgi:hypothetical protein
MSVPSKNITTLFADYCTAYDIYMKKYINNIEDIEKKTSTPPEDLKYKYLYEMLVYSLKILKKKEKDYRYRHSIIVGNPERYVKDMLHFLDDIEKIK